MSTRRKNGALGQSRLSPFFAGFGDGFGVLFVTGAGGGERGGD